MSAFYRLVTDISTNGRLAHHELGQPDEATAALENVSTLIAALHKDPGKKGAPDLLIAEILFREAETKINGKTGSADEPSTPPEKSATTPAEEESNANPDEPDNGDRN